MPHPRSNKNETSRGKFPQPFLLIIPGLLAVGILLMFFVGKSGTHSKDVLYEDLESRIKRIEQRLSRLEQQPSAPSFPRPVPAEKPGKPEPQAKPEQVEREKKVTFHEVTEGDTLFKISRSYGVTLDELRKWNNLLPGEGIRTGQKIRIEKEASSN